MDFNYELYWEKLKVWFEELPEKIKKLPAWYKALPNDEKIAWGTILAGTLLILISIPFF